MLAPRSVGSTGIAHATVTLLAILDDHNGLGGSLPMLRIVSRGSNVSKVEILICVTRFLGAFIREMLLASLYLIQYNQDTKTRPE